MEKNIVPTAHQPWSPITVSPPPADNASSSYAHYAFPPSPSQFPPPEVLALVDKAANAEHRHAQAVIENAQLRQQLAQKQAAEDAYRDLVALNGRLYTTDKTGRLVELLSHEVEWSSHIIPDPPFTFAPCYMVKLKGVDTPLMIRATDYLRDQPLLQALQELPGVKVTLLRQSTRLTANALRDAFSTSMQVVRPNFYGGWVPLSDGNYQFLLSSDHKTHATESSSVPFSPLAGFPSGADVATSVRRLWNEVLTPIQNPSARWLVLLCLHASSLYSLLQHLGHPLPLALCIFSNDSRAVAFFHRLFSGFGDPPLSLDTPPACFSRRLLEYKDEPLLILDVHNSANAKSNSLLLTELLATRQVPWSHKKEQGHFPLQALPVILSRAASALSCAQDCLVLDFGTENFDFGLFSDKNSGISRDIQRYFFNFVRIVQQNLATLNETLARTERDSLSLSEGNLSQRCTQGLSVLLAIDAFFAEILRDFHIQLPGLDADNTNHKAWFLDLLHQTSDKELDCADLVDQFITIARSDLQSGTLCACPTEYTAQPGQNTVYFDAQHLCFTQGAFQSICTRLSCSHPTLVTALSDAGLLLGRPINGTTPMTRISVWNVHGIRQTVRVYKFARSVFDELGEPLVFEGEDVAWN